MSDDTTKKRRPAGAAVAGFVERVNNYPETAIAPVTAEMKDDIRRAAKRRNVSQSAIIRLWLELGRDAD